MNTEYRKKAKNELEKAFFKLMIDSVFGKAMGNVRKHRDIKLVTEDWRRNQLVSEPNYLTSKYFSENLMAIEMKKTKVKLNKPAYLGTSIIGIGKTLMSEFWYDYIKPKYGNRAKLCYTDTNNFIIHIITKDFYKDIANDVKKSFDTSNYDENHKRSLPIGKSKSVIGLFKGELGGKIIKEFCGLRAKIYAYLMHDDDDSKKKKAKGTKKYLIKRRLMFENYNDCLFNDKIILKSQQRFKNDHHNVYTDKINKIALVSNDDKGSQTFDRITTYPHGAFKVSESDDSKKLIC